MAPFLSYTARHEAITHTGRSTGSGDFYGCRPGASLEILDRIVTAYPTYAEAWNKRATLQFMLGNYEASLRDIDKVLDLEPRHFGALAGRGMIYQRQENWTAALNAYREALRMNPSMTGIKNAIQELSKRERDI